MPITFNFTTINSLDATTDTATFGSASNYQVNDSPVEPLQGTNLVEFRTGTAFGGIESNVAISPTWDCRDTELYVWLFNPKSDVDGNNLIGLTNDSLRLRIKSGANFADFNQGHLRLSDGTYPGGFILLRASGGPGSESSNSGTWTATQCAACDGWGIYIDADEALGKNDLEYNADFVRRVDKVVVSGTNSGSPYTLEDIFNESENQALGCVQKVGNFYRFFCGIEFGNGTDSGEFSSTNEYILLDHSSADHTYDIAVKNKFTVNLGTKNVGTDDTYSQDGTIFTVNDTVLFDSASTRPRPNFTVDSAATFNAYASVISGFNTVNLGSNTAGAGNANIELIGADLYDNIDVQFRSNNLVVDNIRVHQLSTDKGDLGAVFSAPSSMKRVQVFNSVNALEYRKSFSLEELNASDNTFDVIVLDNETMTLVNSSFSDGKLKRVT
jgi:hypothetical protein